MPCYRCATRQADPANGPSDWKRGVIGGVQILVCPACQQSHDWQHDLDRCTDCGSTMLVRSLGETRCKSCGNSVVAASGTAPLDDGLATDVEAALNRRFDR